MERAAPLSNGAGYELAHKPKSASNVIEDKHVEVLWSIRRTNGDLAIWRRDLPFALTSGSSLR